MHVMLDHAIGVFVLPRNPAEFRLDVGPEVHACPAPPHEERLPALMRLANEANGGVGCLVVHRLHALLRQGPRVLDSLGAVCVGPAVNHAARAVPLQERSAVGRDHVAGIVLELRLFLGVEVVQIAEELVEPVVRREHLVLVTEVVLPELSRRVPLLLQDDRDRGVFHPHSDIGARKTDLRQARPEHALAHDERRASCRAALFGVVVRKDHAFVGDAVDVRGPVSHHAHGIGADVRLSDVIAPYDEDVGLVLRGGGNGQQQRGQRAERSSKKRILH